MRIRQHNGFGHGLLPGETQDINCPSCKQERENDIEPTITGEDRPLPDYWAMPTLSGFLEGEETPQADYSITLEPLDDQSGIDVEEVNAFTRWLRDVLDSYDGAFRIETDF